MAASVKPQTPEEAAALRELAATHRRQHRWFALCCRVTVSAHTTIILHMTWQDWPLDARDLGPLALFVVHALGGLGWLAWSLRGLCEREAMDASGRCRPCAGEPSARPGPHRRGGQAGAEGRLSPTVPQVGTPTRTMRRKEAFLEKRRNFGR